MSAAPYVPPRGDWQRVEAIEAGFDPQRLAEAALVSIRTGRPVALDGTWRPPA